MSKPPYRSVHSRDPKIPKAVLTSGLSKFYGLYGAVVLLGYLLLGMTSYAPAPDDQRVIPASVRNSPGGYRSYHIWYTGYHGGK